MIQNNQDMNQYFFRASAADFMKIPGSPVAYWLTDAMLENFAKNKKLENISKPKQGATTSDNNRFLRLWHEVSIDKFGAGMDSILSATESGKKWFPYNKGGDFRRWYGNQDFVINYRNNGEDIKEFHDELNKTSPGGRLKNQDCYFKPCISWSKISSGTFAVRYFPKGFIFDVAGSAIFFDKMSDTIFFSGLLNTGLVKHVLAALSPTLNFEAEHLCKIPVITDEDIQRKINPLIEQLTQLSKIDWDALEISWDFSTHSLLSFDFGKDLFDGYKILRNRCYDYIHEMQLLEQESNRLFIEAYGLIDELASDVPLDEITLTCNPHYRYGGNRSEEELEALLQCDTIKELISYAIGCMMGRYSLDKPGLILASQGETLQDYLRQIPSPRFMPDDDAILPLTSMEWFPDDATHRFRDFIRAVWGAENLQENLRFVADSLCLHAIKPQKGEDSLDTIRRYLSTQFFKDHLRTYKKRPIYWLFSSGKHKAFECLVYLHRYNESTLARMRTEYVIPLTAKMATYVQKLEADKDASTSAAEVKRLEKEIAQLHKQQAELSEFDEKLRHYADQRISLDLDDGVKVNYGKFGDLLAEVKAVTGESPEVLS